MSQKLNEKLKENRVRNFIVNQKDIDGLYPYKMMGDGRGIAELKKQVKQGKFKITRDVGKIVALKHIVDQNLEGEKIHGRVLNSPVIPKKPKFEFDLNKASFSQSYMKEKMKSEAELKVYMEKSDDNIEREGNIIPLTI